MELNSRGPRSPIRATPPFQVLLRKKVDGIGGALAIFPSNQPSFSVLLLNGPVATFLPSAEFDRDGFTPFFECFGCIGVIPMNSEPYVGFITSVNVVGELESSPIFQIRGATFCSLNDPESDLRFLDPPTTIPSPSSSSTSLSTLPSSSSSQLLALHPCYQLSRFYSNGTFYFSNDRDLTLCSQRQNLQKDPAREGSSYWDRVDTRFFWNRYPLKDLIRLQELFCPQEHRLLVPIIQGYVGIRELPSLSPGIKVAVISRVSCERTGTRFFARGVDDAGHVSNFIETEQLVYNDEFCVSFVQTRGSVPVFWEQRGLQVGVARFELSRGTAATAPAFERHFRLMIDRYGTQRIMNLLSQRGGETVLGTAYESHVTLARNPRIRYSSFDFHELCKNENFANIRLLLKEIEPDLDEFQSFLFNHVTKEVITQQNGVIRTNCFDCLDRTNMAQSVIAERALEIQIACYGWAFTARKAFEQGLSDLWASNADASSQIFAGSDALRSEFTRTGKRTLGGMVEDVLKSVSRMYVNNFQDPLKQSTIDILLGYSYKRQRKERLVWSPILQALDQEMQEATDLLKRKRLFKIQIGTYNVNTRQMLCQETLHPFVSPESLETPDIYAITFQELVALSPRHVIVTDGSERKAWEDEIARILNEQIHDRYVLIRSDQLVASSLAIFMKLEHVHLLKNVDVSTCKTGLSGMTGNKGAVGIRFELCDSTLCFIASHFASGQEAYAERIRDYRTVAEGLVFSRGWKIDDHDLIFWFGDFNYRINLPNEEIRRRAIAMDLPTLYRYDQLRTARENGEAFQYFAEGPLSFPPSYRYDIGVERFDTSDKYRAPAWTDRILWAGAGIRQLFYRRVELFSSDHRPVKAYFEVEVTQFDHGARSHAEKEIFGVFKERIERGEQVRPPLPPRERQNPKRVQGAPLSHPLPQIPAATRPISTPSSSQSNAPPLPPRPSSKQNEGTQVGLLIDFSDSTPPISAGTSTWNPSPPPQSQPSPVNGFPPGWTSSPAPLYPTPLPTSGNLISFSSTQEQFDPLFSL